MLQEIVTTPKSFECTVKTRHGVDRAVKDTAVESRIMHGMNFGGWLIVAMVSSRRADKSKDTNETVFSRPNCATVTLY